jgi:hypothetical protein
MEVIQWRIKIKSVHIPAVIVQFKVGIHFAVIIVRSKVLEIPVNADIRVVEIIKK